MREGPLALYKGWGRSVAKNMPFDAVLFAVYEDARTKLLAARCGGKGGGEAV